jgi:hypothetical protein
MLLPLADLLQEVVLVHFKNLVELVEVLVVEECCRQLQVLLDLVGNNQSLVIFQKLGHLHLRLRFLRQRLGLVTLVLDLETGPLLLLK